MFESPIDPQSPTGEPRYWGMDGITIGPDGNFYIVIVRTDELVALPPDGESSSITLRSPWARGVY
jgi:hypothetical protein